MSEIRTLIPKKGRFAWPLAIMSFGRPDLLAGVLRDLRDQTLSLDDRQVHLFQDGNVDTETGKVLVEDCVRDDCIARFREVFPEGNIIASKVNLGIAFNFDRAERVTLGPSGAEAAAFFEDDMALSEHYLEALSGLIDFALNEELVGYVAAYGEHRARLDEQLERRNEIVPMRHKWGFGLTRRQWERQMPIIEPYLRLIEGKNYVDRDHRRIHAYFDSLGYGNSGSSQDAAKDVASDVLGTTKLMCYVCYGKYLGKTGVHQLAEEYRKAGYADTVLFPHPVDAFNLPNKERLDKMIAWQRDAARTATAAAVQHVASPRTKANLGDPHLFGGELEALARIMRDGHRRYQEFGAGGSTLLAIRSGLERVVAIDSDPDWVAAVRSNPEIAAAIETGRADILHADIGPVAEWGNPKSRDQTEKWPNYFAAAWETWARRAEKPDLVYVDGRFRVACCLSVILTVGVNAELRLLLHDVGPERPYYEEVLEFFDVVEQVNTLMVLKTKRDVATSKVMSVFLRRQFDQR